MNIFFCDISGTFTGDVNREQSLKNLADNLNRLIESEDIPNLKFSFISSENPEFIKQYVKELKKYITNPKIQLGTHYGFDKKFIEGEEPVECPMGKAGQIIDELKHYDNINKIYYDDDTPIYHVMIDYIARISDIPINSFIHIIPGIDEDNEVFDNIDVDNIRYSILGGIQGLNKCISDCCYKKSNCNSK